MRLTVLLVALITMMPAFASADDLSVEDDTMADLPKQISEAIQHAEGANLKDAIHFKSGFCKLIGKPVDLGQGAQPAYFVTTANACNWGAAVGPIWLVLNEPHPVVVLSYGGATMTLEKKGQNGFPNIVISAGTAGWTQKSWWTYDGERYVKTKEEICSVQEDTSFKCRMR